jgi:hypothetical protein
MDEVGQMWSESGFAAPAQGNRVGFITKGGGWAVIATVMCSFKGLSLPPLDDAIIEKLDKVLPPFWSRANPVDLVAPGKVSVITDSVGFSRNAEDRLGYREGTRLYDTKAERLLTVDLVAKAENREICKHTHQREHRLFISCAT